MFGPALVQVGGFKRSAGAGTCVLSESVCFCLFPLQLRTTLAGFCLDVSLAFAVSQAGWPSSALH